VPTNYPLSIDRRFRRNRSGMSSLQTITLIAVASVILISVAQLGRKGETWMTDNVETLQRATLGIGQNDGGQNVGTSKPNATIQVPAKLPVRPTSPSGSPVKTQPTKASPAAGSSPNTPSSNSGPNSTGPVPASEVKKTLDAVDHQELSLGQSQVTNSVEFNRIVPGNTKSKNQKYRALQKANRTVIAARKTLESASTAAQRKAAQKRLDFATRNQASKSQAIHTYMKGQLDKNPELKRARAATKNREKEKRRLVRSGADPAEIARAEAAIVRAKKDEARIRRELNDAIDNFDPLVSIAKTKHVVEIDGEKVTLTNVVDTPFTNDWNTMQGKIKGQGLEHVREQLEATGMSDDRQRIFAGIVKSESSKGGFTQFQSWDRAKVTWGFAQFTLGKNGNYNISKILADVKDQDPDVFKKRFQDFGIDVVTQEGQIVIQVTRPDGTVLSGAQAADFLRTAPKQAAALIVAGTDPVVQQAQINFANQTITKQLKREVRLNGIDGAGNATSNTVRLDDVITSEYGVGVLADRSINAGAPKTYKMARQELERYVNKHNLDPNNVSQWAAEAEKAVIRKLEQNAIPGRIKNLKSEGLSRTPGSFDN
jgi:hypothetical protein